jgi:pimeloyl-ACP methyl ester carboxylesterase
LLSFARAVLASLVLTTSPALAVETFSAKALIEGTFISEANCAKIGHAVYVTAFNEGFCIRYYTGGQPLSGEKAAVFFTGDVLGTDGKGHLVADPGYLTGAPDYLEIAARVWSERLKAPVIFFARMGMHGSSGWHGNRRTQLEIEVTRQALEAIRLKESISGFYLVGQSAGGMLAEGVAATRDDVSCLVVASTPSDFAQFTKRFGITLKTGTAKLSHYQPMLDAAAIAGKKDMRIIALMDPQDTVVPTPIQTSFLDKLTALGHPILTVRTGARGAEHHALIEKALFVTGQCIANAPDADILKAFGGTAGEDLPR